MRLPRINWVDPKSNDKCSYNWSKRDYRQKRRPCDHRDKDWSDASNHQNQEEAKTDSPQSPRREHRPAGFQTSRLQDFERIDFGWFNPPSVW